MATEGCCSGSVPAEFPGTVTQEKGACAGLSEAGGPGVDSGSCLRVSLGDGQSPSRLPFLTSQLPDPQQETPGSDVDRPQLSPGPRLPGD